MNRRLQDAITIPPAQRTVSGLLQHYSRQEGRRELFRCAPVVWTVAQAVALAAGQAAALQAAGVVRGDRVAIFCGNRPEFMRVFLACAWLGAIAVPINTACRGPQLHYYLQDSGARLLAIEAGLLPELATMVREGLALEQLWLIGEDAPAGGMPAFEGGTCSIDQLPEPMAPIEAAPSGPGDTVAILYTSGTTGPSKGVCCPHAQFFWWGVQTAMLLEIVEGDVLCTTLPLFHTNALNCFFQALIAGATQVVEPRFSASAFWSTMVRHQATVGYLLGAMVPILLAQPLTPEERTHRLRVALGPGVPPQLHANFRERTGVVLLEGYGSTETNFVIGARASEPRPPGMGYVLPGFDANVVDELDEVVPPDTPGELVLRADAPFVFATGYFGMPEKTVEAWRNLWFHTGDRVLRRPDGCFVFLDRIKDAIRRRGENISSYEVEQVLLSHPAVENAAIYPVRSDLAEDEVMAAVVRKPGHTLEAIDLMVFCEPRLPYFSVPRYVDFLEHLPRTENGKVQKFRLRERGVTATTWDRIAAGYTIERRR